MSPELDPNFDQLLIICTIAAVLVIGIILFVIKLPDDDNVYINTSSNKNKNDVGKKNCPRDSDEDTEF